jgi:prepilin-type N-terminal cleavage/methylation domain-containing protein
MKLSPPLNSKSGFTLVEVLVAVAISGIFMVFLIEIFYGQTRLTSNQQENRSFIQLTALIQLLIKFVPWNRFCPKPSRDSNPSRN